MRTLRSTPANLAAAVALAVASAGFALCGAQSAHAAHHEDAGAYTFWIWSEDDDKEQHIVVTRDAPEQPAIAGVYATDRRSEARLMSDAEAERAIADFQEMIEAEEISVIMVDKHGRGGVDIEAEGDDGEQVVIKIGEGGIRISSEDGDDRFNLEFTGDYSDDDVGEVVIEKDDQSTVIVRDEKRVTVRAHSDSDDESIIMIKGADAEEAEEFIDDLDDVPRAIKNQMKDRFGL